VIDAVEIFALFMGIGAVVIGVCAIGYMIRVVFFDRSGR